ncbi:cleavage and polyadenylation specificity factor subunit 7 isoform X1 [Anolis sagrei]|uniref:cleavage and polyadenylation specificity factor subunit 7 isoform X1 n=2 Tax=Anolis sagrei TaxID=38937 RepID=UPI00295A907A|nr:cleavage and polyadenylation specificity factor subunit 7 isoform X1 [Anolis sagrei ordinatus]XP_060626861.1 cleavage and polyadenylation specificity factor subunit 7 isoform X1 [Anolis sagrei ordinatus]XP_060626869.1 cleavage and polyadenylation specificity factor subunit 7 isoform X1 [Anolis sagrei ordinatus]
MSEGVDLIDIYADEEFNQDSEFSNADQMDLYDDVLAASSQPSESCPSSSEPPTENRQEQSPKPNNKSPAILYTYSGLRNKRAAVYVGSFSWWTTDQQLIRIIRSVGVYDVVELKFAENRANGQSKGYAEVVVASENSVHKLLELLPGKFLNGDKMDVKLATRQNLALFEAQARKRVPPRTHSRDSTDSIDGRATPTENTVPPPRIEKPPSVLPFFNRPPSALPLMGLPPPPPIPPPPPLSSSFGVPPPPPGIHYQHLMPPPPRLPPHLAVPPPGAIPPALHLNPAFFPPPNAAMGPPPDPYSKASAPYNHNSRELIPLQPPLSEAEFEDIMNRNRAISSSAISKAVSGASAGDYSDAIETLLTAIAVIKQSRVSNDERCRVLISSLKDCLHGIEAKSYSVGASGSGGSSSRKRHRSRERSPSRSRDSSRRHRDMVHDEDWHEEYFQERGREHERHRDRDRERDRHH